MEQRNAIYYFTQKINGANISDALKYLDYYIRDTVHYGNIYHRSSEIEYNVEIIKRWIDALNQVKFHEQNGVIFREMQNI